MKTGSASMSLRRITFNTAFMSSITCFRMLAQIMVIPLLARILSPADYGIVAIAMPFILFAMMFADAGVGLSLVRTPLTSTVVWSTSFWTTLLLGIALTIVISIFGYGAALFFAEPALYSVITALSFTIFLQAAAAIPGAALLQQKNFKMIAFIEIVSISLSLLTAVVTALRGGGLWALVAQQMVQCLVKLLLTLYYSPFRPTRTLLLSGLHDHLIFGRNFVGASVINFINQSIDNIAIGKVLGPALLGFYTMAFLFARLPYRLVSGPLGQVLYPHFIEIRDNKAHLRHLFMFLTRLVAIIIFPGMAMLACAYQPIFTFLLSEKWLPAGRLFQLLAPAMALLTATALRTTIMMALDRTDMLLRQETERLLLWSFALGTSVFFGTDKVAFAFNLVVIPYLFRSLIQILPLIELSLGCYLRTMILPMMISLICIMAYCMITAALNGTTLQKTAIAASLAFIGICLSTFFQARHLLREFRLIKNVQNT